MHDKVTLHAAYAYHHHILAGCTCTAAGGRRGACDLHLAGADEEHGRKQRDEERLFLPCAHGRRDKIEEKNGVGEVVSAVSPPFSGTFRPFFTHTQRSVQTECLVDWKKLGWFSSQKILQNFSDSPSH
jgi:hypothetical protein